MTSLRFAQWSRRLRLRDTKRVLEGLVDHAFLYEWNELLLSRVATGCDLGVIPLDLTDPLARGKPENKLILMWRMGLPTIASATPSYLRAMDAAGLDMACATDDEWLEKLEAYGSTETARRDAGRQGRDYAEREFATEKILARWDAVLGSLGLA
jgi:glycosyltransferase involved in cell wall biosynthesis